MYRPIAEGTMHLLCRRRRTRCCQVPLQHPADHMVHMHVLVQGRQDLLYTDVTGRRQRATSFACLGCYGSAMPPGCVFACICCAKGSCCCCCSAAVQPALSRSGVCCCLTSARACWLACAEAAGCCWLMRWGWARLRRCGQVEDVGFVLVSCGNLYGVNVGQSRARCVVADEMGLGKTAQVRGGCIVVAG
jgi:hypothetical protein